MVRYLMEYVCVGLISLQMVLGHFTVTYPSSRGFNEDQEPIGPCGGFNTASAQRTAFPLQDGFIEINSGHTSYSYQINAIQGNTTVNVGSGSRAYPQAACLPLTLDKSITEGTNATLQVIYNGGDGLLYQCIDATFANQVNGFNKSACVNADGSSNNNNNNNNNHPTSNAATIQISGTLLVALFTYLLA
ncbi:hypothetical protein BY458DRAFT_504897 [Sporodiniella umbellata]|nr:hypothetical protein BY458DRAFT_504897 [Sporodiniella umbellata]